jgi:DNA-binding transcriptional regulator LsrR (DeoR family)
MSEPELYKSELLRRVAKWLYDEGLEITEIRDRLRIEIGRPKLDTRTVKKMLKLARSSGVVRIEYPPVLENQMESQLREIHPHLQKVIVMPDADEYDDLLARWGDEAARYFEQLVGEGEAHIGISGGETLLSFVNAVHEHPRKQVHIYTTALIGRGELDKEDSHVDPLVNAQMLWSKCGRIPGRCHYATVPPYDGLTREQIAEELRELSRRQPIREVIERMNDITVAFVGLGLANTPRRERNQITMTGLLRQIVAPKKLEGEGAVGDLAYCLFDKNGNTRKEWQFFITAGYCNPEHAGIEFYKQMVRDKKKVVVIAGSFKQAVILPALNAKLFNVWITDESTAEWVLKQS